MDRVAATMTPPCWTTTSRLTTCRLIASRWRASKFSYDPDWSWPPSASPNLPDHGLQVYLQSCFITASKWISQFTQSRPRSASPRVLNDSLQLHLQTCSSTALKLMTEFTWSRSQTECPKTLDPSHQVRTSIALQVSSTLARLWPRSASLSSLTFGLQMHLQSCLLMASKFAQPWPPNSLSYGLELHHWVHSILACKCISKLTQSQPTTKSLSSHNHAVVTRQSSHGIGRECMKMNSSGSRRVGSGSEDMKCYLAMMNSKNCLVLWHFSKCGWDQELGKIDCIFRIMRWCLCIPGSPKYIFPLAQSVSVIPRSLYAPLQLPPAKLNGSGGEKQIFPPLWAPSASLSALNCRLQVLLQSCLSTICCQINCMDIYRET